MLDKSGGQPLAKRKVQSTMASARNDCNIPRMFIVVILQ